MSYRQSTYDPLAYKPVYGPPLKPYNWVQWLGFVQGCLGTIALAVFLAGEAGLTRPFSHNLVSPLIMLGFTGSLMLNSRRVEIPVEEQAAYRAKHRRQAFIVLTGTALAILVGIVIKFTKGA